MLWYRSPVIKIIQAAYHELRCVECRVTWKSWLQRLTGNKKGFSPKPTIKQIAKNEKLIAKYISKKYTEV